MFETIFEMLVQIPGQTFLLYFAVIAVVCIILGWLWANDDGSTAYQLPELTRFDPVAIATLRGGVNSVIRTAVFSLWNKKLVEFKEEEKDTTIKAVNSYEGTKLGTIEKEIYDFVRTSASTRVLFEDNDLKEKIEMHLRPVKAELENLHLVRTAEDRVRTWKAAITMSFIIIATGGTKLYLGITHGRPVGLLILSLIVSVIALYVVLNPGAIPTRLGRRYLEELEGHFDWLKESIKDTRSPEGIDPSLAIAIFGIGILGASTMYDPFNKAFPADKAGSGGCGGGCGGYYGGDTGGGGGCSGGGCGGGCGGCGGCGG